MPSAIRIRVALVDPDIHYRLFLTTSVNESPRHMLLNTATNASEALEWSDFSAPDVVLVEAELPDTTGADLIRRLRQRYANTLFLVLTNGRQERQIAEAIQAGACGYLMKSDGKKAVFDAIDDALSGGAPLSRPVAREVLNYLRNSAPPFAKE